MQRVRQEKVNRENDERKDFLWQKKILEAQAKVYAEADHDELEALKQEHLKEFLDKPDSPDLSDSPDLPSLLLYSQDSSLLNQDDLLDVEAARVQLSAPVFQSVAVQTMEAVTNEVEVEALRVQPSISVPNDPISEVANIQIPMSVSNNAIVEATNAQPLLPSSKDVSVESGRHYSPMSVDVFVESGRHYSPMSVDVSMESAETVLLSPSISLTSGASSLCVGHVKSSRNRIPQPYTIRSRARFPAEGDSFMSDQDKEMAMLEEATKNVPDFNLPANFSFTKNVSHSLTSNFFN